MQLSGINTGAARNYSKLDVSTTALHSNEVTMPAKPAKPTIVLIPGACTRASCFDRLTPYLHDAGYETVAVSHPSANPPDPFAHTAETMALNVQNMYVQPLLDAGKDIVVYAYSSGGSQTGTSGPSWVKSDREARGYNGGVVGIVYHSCAPVPAGMDQLTFMGGVWPPFIKEDVV
jgi:hypothetical protein